MSGPRRSSRVTEKSCLSMKLNVSNQIEFVDSHGVVDSTEWTAEIDGLEIEDYTNEGEGEEELIVNADGTMTIKMAPKSNANEQIVSQRFDCEKCGLSFPNDEALVRHENICRHMPFHEIAYRDEEDFANVDVYHSRYETICYCCNEDLSTAHYGHVKCNFCPKSFKSHGSLERHLFLLHSASTEFSCEYCNATCSSASVLDVHTAQHKSSGKPFSCQRCGKDFTRKYHLDRHLQYTDCDLSKPKKEVPCHVCGKTFSRTDNLREHLRGHIGQSSRKRDYQCPHCEKSFYGSSLLNIHIRTHTGEKPFPCDLCEKSFPSNGALRKHRRSHTGEKPYSCTMCDGRFSAKETLNRHVKVHTGERPHKCKLCPKSFIQSTQLKAHMFYHGEHGFECEQCGDQFGRKNRLMSHIKLVHENSLAVLCDICKKHFSSKYVLKKHMLEHIGNSPEQTCDICKRLFSTKQALHNHHKRVHDDDKSSHTCEICGKSFDGLVSVKRHISRMHKGKNVSIKNRLPTEKRATFDVILTGDGNDSLEIESIELINEDSRAPDTYKIICSGDNSDHFVAELSTIDETIVPDEEPPMVMDAMALKARVAELLKIVVDEDVLNKFGYPTVDVDSVLTSVLMECDQKPVRATTCADVETKIRENVKLLFTTVIGDDSIKEMLNNHTVDEVIEHVIKLADSE